MVIVRSIGRWTMSVPAPTGEARQPRPHSGFRDDPLLRDLRGADLLAARAGSCARLVCAFRRLFAVAGIVISVALLLPLEFRQILLLSVTSAIAAGNWWWARRKTAGTPSGKLPAMY